MNVETKACGCRVSAGQTVQHCVEHYGLKRARGPSYHHIEFDVQTPALDAIRDAIGDYISGDAGTHNQILEDDPLWTELMNVSNLLMCAGQIRDEEVKRLNQRTEKPPIDNGDLL